MALLYMFKGVNETVDGVFKLSKQTSGSYVVVLKSDYELITENRNKSKQNQYEPSSVTSLSHSLKHNKKPVPNVYFVGTKTTCVGNLHKDLNIDDGLNRQVYCWW